MVVLRCFCIFLFLASGLLADPVVQVRVDEHATDPLRVFVTVTHGPGEEVDEKSFLLGEEPLVVESLGSSSQSSIRIFNGRREETHHQISQYVFHLEPLPEGEHSLPSLSVEVAGRRVHAPASSFTLRGAKESSAFRLEAFVDGSRTLYPGQRTRLGYRIVSQNDVEVTQQALPLLDAKGLKKIGEREVRSQRLAQGFYQEVVQEVEAREAGNFSLGPSFLEGFPYREDFFGRRSYGKTKWRAEAPALSVEVKAFPTEGKPLFFSGALGDTRISARLMNTEEVYVGDKVIVEVTVTGSEDPSQLELPPLQRMADLRAFRLNDLPPQREEWVGGKRFFVELRPLSPAVRAIPPLHFASFLPEEGRYHLIATEALPLRVQPLQELPSLSPEKMPVAEEEATLLLEPSLEEIAILGLQGETAPPWKGWRWVYFHPLSLFAAFIVFALLPLWVRSLLRRHKSSKQNSSQRYWKKAREQQSLDALERVFTRVLREKNVATELRHLPREGLWGELRAFFERVDQQRFAGEAEETDTRRLFDEAEPLFQRLQQGGKK